MFVVFTFYSYISFDALAFIFVFVPLAFYSYISFDALAFVFVFVAFTVIFTFYLMHCHLSLCLLLLQLHFI